MNLFKRIKRHFIKLRFTPIRVFCFHQVSDEFDAKTMWECDWTQTVVFKKKILALKEKYTFISLTEAYNYIANDKIRFKKYAALTADDGWASLKNIIPWLAEQGIPVTLFLNPLCLDGEHYQSRETDKLLDMKDVLAMVTQYAPFISVASHGWSHEDCLKMTREEFEYNVVTAESAIAEIKGKIPFYAFTFGRRKDEQIEVLRHHSLIPVLMDGVQNEHDPGCIHRECLDG